MKRTSSHSQNAGRVLFGFALAGLVWAAGSLQAMAQSKSGFTYNGMDLADYTQVDYLSSTEAAQSIQATEANYTAVMATWYVQTAASTSIAPASYSPSDTAVATAIQALEAQGITVTLKPHVDSMDGTWRGQFTWPATDTTTAQQEAWLTDWFTSYQAFILHFAQIASANGVGILVIGTEFKELTGSNCPNPGGTSCQFYWDQYVIDPLRQQYPNLTLAYGANATGAGDEFTTVTFWNDVDIIGVDGYFPLSKQADPTIQQLVNAWTVAADNTNNYDPFAALQNLQAANNKPLIFTEIGYESTPGTNEQPWNYQLSDGVDDTEQQNCYEAFFEVFGGQSWMNGVFWWAWSTSAPDVSTDTGYSPQGKPAGTQTLPEWYGAASPSFTIAAANPALTVSAGLSATTLISITPLDGFTGTVALAASGLPSGVTTSFSPGTVANTQLLTLTAASSAAVGGPVKVTVAGTSNSLTASTAIELTVSASPGFELSATSSFATVVEGSSTTDTIEITDAGGFSGNVTLSASGLPSGVTASFATNPAAVSSVLTLTATGSATIGGPVNVTITGTNGSLTASTTISLTVSAAANFTLAASPSSVTLAQGGTVTSTISVTAGSGFTGGVTLDASDLPPGVTASFSPNPTVNGSSMMTLTASSSAELGGPVSVTITGTAGSLSAATTVGVTVNLPSSFILSASPNQVSIAQGSNQTDSISVAAVGGFTGSIAFSVTGLPSGVTGSFNPTQSASGSTVLTLTASNNAPLVGPVTVTITGTSGNLFEETSLSLTVTGVETFTLTGGSAVTVAPGAVTGNSTAFTLSAVNGFTGTVNFACAISPAATSDPPTCALGASSVSLDTTTTNVAVVVTIGTTAPMSAAKQVNRFFWPPAGGTALALVLFIALPRRRNWLAMLAFLAFFAAMGAAGCNSNPKSSATSNPGTSAGNYNVTLTATSGTITQSGTFALTVQ